MKLVNFFAQHYRDTMHSLVVITQPPFVEREKTRPLKILECRIDFQEMFRSLGDDEELNQEMLEKFEEFVCTMYGRRKCTKVNEARFEIFLEKYKVPSSKKLSNVKKFVSGMLPPCFKVLHEKNQESEAYHAKMDVFNMAETAY